MKLALFILFSHITSFLYCQNDNDQYRYLQSYHSIGINEVTKDSIYAVDISFVNNISDFIFDSVNQVLLSYFALYANEGGKTNYDYINAYSLKASKMLWAKIVDRTKEKYNFIDGKLYANSTKFNGLLDVLNDTFKWKTKSNIIIHPDLIARNVVLVPQFKNQEGIKVCAALNASNGEPIWINDSLELKMGIVSEPTIRGNNIIFLNTHLISLNLNSGKYWQSENQMNRILGKDEKFFGEFGLTLLSATIGFGIAGAIGSNVVSYSIVDLGPTGLKTNAPLYINDSGFIYVVGIEGMRKYDSEGKLLGSIGHTNRNNIEKILISKNQMYFIDPGNSIVNNIKRSILNSSFYLSRLNSNLETEKSIHLTDNFELLYKDLGNFHIKTDFFRDTFFVLFRNGFFALDTNLNFLGKFSRSKKEDPEYRNLLLNDFYIYSDSAWIKQHNGNSLKYLERLDKSIDVVNSQFQLVKNIPRRDIYKIYYQDDLITAAVNADGKSFLLDRKDRAIIDMVRIEKIQKHNDQYYIANLNGYFIIKADQLVK
jgi:hypothetical protein